MGSLRVRLVFALVGLILTLCIGGRVIGGEEGMTYLPLIVNAPTPTSTPTRTATSTPTPTPMPTLLGKIAFTSNRDGNREVYVMNADGTNVRNVTNDPSPDGMPTWSPDGTRIAFWSQRGAGPHLWDIFVVGADGSNCAWLTEGDSPSWAPDGTRIAFTSFNTWTWVSRLGWAPGWDGNWNIFVIGADGSGRTNLTNDMGYASDATWSPDATMIAYAYEDGGNRDIWVMSASGTDRIRLTTNTGKDASPAWSPDGAKIAFESWLSGTSYIHLMNPDGSHQTLLTQGESPTWSPDGAWVAFSRLGNIRVIGRHGTSEIQLTQDGGWEPSWH